MPLRKPAVPFATGTAEVDPLLKLAAALSVQSLDLRAQYEAKLRILTAIQRELETFRSPSATATQRRQTIERLEKRFDDLTAANRDAGDTLKMIREEFDRVRRKTDAAHMGRTSLRH